MGPAIESPRPKVFYGWVIVAVMAAVGALSMALGTLNFGLFVKPMGDDLGIGRGIFGWAQSSRQFASAATSPMVGNLLDRFGARVLLTIAAITTMVALIGLGFMYEGWHMIALFGVMGLVGMSGPGALVTSVPVTKWFVKKRGKALSFTSLGVPIGGLIFVPLTQILIDGFGWRTAWIILALLGGGLIIPLAILYVRREPEDMGLLPDGKAPEKVTSASDADPRRSGHLVPVPDERSWTREEALRSPTFWRLVVVFSMVMLAISTVAIHRIPSFMDRGLNPQLISYATALDAAAAGMSTFAMGFLIRYVPARFVGAGGFLMLTTASILTILSDTHPMMFASMICFGLGIGVLGLMQNYLWAEYFGRKHLGGIRGAVTPITLVFGGIGAPISGYVRDATGTYNGVWIAAIVLMALGAVILSFTPPPPPPLVLEAVVDSV